ncbi:hypothetical protein, unknown function [Leishmania mexicana MHOM/GT/2001/U1103]|uniref:Uncharacterized protein n=1 Tax=Leishmania mexicana (strain MHOM/GT/2001/U1103) TaxID=929439 RepID=E9AYF7_LEIMU|nr:hypothetical protein, unknown function [Leishmania mexicana MHOM/GT/2001/U1103]CBZ27999.1 hypothetical protein, unknown function [Leishmania mexicana MHOM/GT/2001/U1103]
MKGTRLQEVNARGDTAAIAAQLKAIEESEGTATQKARDQGALLHECEQRWPHEMLDKRRT